MTAPTLARPPRRGTRGLRIRRTEFWVYLFLLPTIVLYGLFTVYPIIGSYWYSFLDWNGFDAVKDFIGLANYAEAIHDPLFWNAFKVTVLFTVVAVPLKVIGAFALAMVLNSPRMPWRGFFRTAFFLPVVTTTAIVGIVMQFVFDPASGPVNLVLIKLGLVDQGVNFLGSSKTALWTVIAVFTWKWLGQTLIYWLAALQTIPRELYEAAAIDGASSSKITWHVTLPLLKPFTIIITLLTIESTLHVFDLMLTMTGGGPFYSTQVLEIFIYEQAFTSTVPRLGYASAAAVLFGLFVFLIGLLQLIGIRAAQKARQ
ncbi:carbohydrate ABC transporter permease [Microlunatus soli]|uniref:Carbohydrate ABC transporter membrane protein 1, CUT1 family n=1 Tax=Microlunatus soli TaxID=630515 RepID=A0A1H1Z2N1_9ACTN|nr:sugar ABC transporter permease [Microlunatus soli]SDT27948.1 carbohydrate ABC transporter membrane protein 1, CUT1 family [Microlunatus soli]